MTSPPPPQLDYGQPLPLLRQKRVRRWIVLIVGLTGATLLAPLLWHQGILLYWDHECRVYTAPADRVVFENDPAASGALLRTGPDYFVMKMDFPTNPMAVGSACPECWTRLNQLGEFHYVYPHTWKHLSTDGGGTVTLFLHERRSHSGISRIVAIDCDFNTNPFEDPMQPVYVTVDMSSNGGLKLSPTARPRLKLDFIPFVSPFGYLRIKPIRSMRIFAGQPDPTDASHFTIAYESQGKKGTIDGWLQDDDTVTLKVRHYATTQQRP